MITKLQKEYLEKRLNNIVNKKLNEWKEKNPEPDDFRNKDFIFGLLKSGKAKLRKNTENSYSWYDVKAYFDLDDIENKSYQEKKEWQEKRDAVWDKMKDKANILMDKVIFEGLDLQGALEEIESMKF